MAWNEPGGSGNKDPWSGKSGGDQQGPPDLDEVVRKLQESLGGLFGGKKRPSAPEPDDQGGGPGGGRGGGFPSLPGGGLNGKVFGVLGGSCWWSGSCPASISSSRRSAVWSCASGPMPT